MTIAAWMQPLQYDLQSSAAKDNSITHAAAAPSNLDAATPMRSAETELQNTIELRAMASEIAAPKPDGSRRQSEKKTILKHFLKGILKGKLLAPKLGKSADKWLSQPGCSHSNTIYNLQLQKTIVLRMQPRRQATLTQPFQCDLQAQIPKHPITTHTQAHPKQLEATVTLRQKKTINRPQPHPPHRRGTFHRRLQPLYTEKHKVSCSGFLPKTEPLQHHAAIPMRSASTDSKTPYNYAHTSTPKAAWSHRYTAAKKNRQTDRSRTRRTDEVPFIVACSHFTRKNTRFRAPASSPQQSPCNIMQPFQCDLQAQIPKHPITTHTQAHPKQLEATVTLRQKKNDKPTAAAPAAQTRYLSSSPAATLHGKTQGFVLRLPPQNKALATSCSHSNAICKHRFQNTL